MPQNLDEFIKTLEFNLKTVRAKSREVQMEIAVERAKANDAVMQYEVGDLLLFNAREDPCSFLETKLSPEWLGPYKVVPQNKGEEFSCNDIPVEHLVMNTRHIVHKDRVKPFFGSVEEAWELALLDYHQYDIASINYFIGNPHIRRSMAFNVTFTLGASSDTKMIQFNPDFCATEQYHAYIHSIPYLFPLRFPATKAKKEINAKRKLHITQYGLNDLLYVDLRYFDGYKTEHFDSLQLPNKHMFYYVEGIVRRVDQKRLYVELPVIRQFIELDNYDLYAVTVPFNQLDITKMVLISVNNRIEFPSVFNAFRA